ncbi:MAG: ATP-binding protein [Gemmatimonadota bacterium]|nr:GAF domain-containing protein [Gemmatimonadota bacterium]
MTDDEGRTTRSRLTRISRELTYARSTQDVLDLAASSACELLNARRALVLLTDEQGLLRIHAVHGMDHVDGSQFAEPLDERLASRLEELLGDGIAAPFLGVPLVVAHSVVGLLAVRRETRQPPSTYEEQVLSALADQAALAVQSLRDEAARAALEARIGELARDQEERDEAIKMLGHDLRSPLAAIQAYLDLLTGRFLGPLNPRQVDALQRIRSVTDHLTSVVTGMVEMARLTGGEATLRSEPVEVREAVQHALEIVEPSAREAGIRFRLEGPEGLCVLGDGDRLRQVLINLLDNAVKYGPDDSEVTVAWSQRADPADPRAEVAVRDRGPGIPPERLDSLFDPFVRHDGPAPRGRNGLGLGLAIARDLTRKMEGALTVESVVGKGTIFRLVLPVPGRPRPQTRH